MLLDMQRSKKRNRKIILVKAEQPNISVNCCVPICKWCHKPFHNTIDLPLPLCIVKRKQLHHRYNARNTPLHNKAIVSPDEIKKSVFKLYTERKQILKLTLGSERKQRVKKDGKKYKKKIEEDEESAKEDSRCCCYMIAIHINNDSKNNFISPIRIRTLIKRKYKTLSSESGEKRKTEIDK